MTKYLLCIWFGILLIAGTDSVADQSLQNFQTKTGSADMQTYLTSTDYDSPAFISPSGTKADYNKEHYSNYTISDGICGNCSLSRSLPSEKNVRPHFASFITQKLSTSKPRRPEERWTDFTLLTNLSKYSNSYYLYALKRILI